MPQIKAKAKINLFFHITGRQHNKYHLIESLVVFADDIYDTIDIQKAAENHTSVIGGEFSYMLPSGEQNLINKVLASLDYETKHHCYLTKDIPVGAGLGGGSSDAAQVAKFISNQDYIPSSIIPLGADLAVCYHNQAAFCSGIGEIVTPVTRFPTIYLVLINPRQFMSTALVFEHNQINNTPSIEAIPYDFERNQDKLIDFLSSLNNDLTASAISLMPSIQSYIELIAKQPGCRISRMSGSGPTCFGIFIDQLSAMQAYQTITHSHPELWVKYTRVQ